MTKESCSIIDRTNNQVQEYKISGAVDSKDTSAITFVNKGTNTAVINGFPLAPGQVLSFGNDKCSLDCTQYQLTFIGAGTSSVYVFRGETAITLSNILSAGSGGVHVPVNIFDSTGANLLANAGRLTVYDLSVLNELISFASQNHSDLIQVDSDINLFKSANHSDFHTYLFYAGDSVAGWAASAASSSANVQGNTASMDSKLTTIINLLSQLTALISSGGLNVNIIQPVALDGAGNPTVQVQVQV